MAEIKALYAKDNEGVTHLISAVFSDYTLCGNAFEGYLDADDVRGEPDNSWEPTRNGPVDCPTCLKQILACRSTKINLATGNRQRKKSTQASPELAKALQTLLAG